MLIFGRFRGRRCLDLLGKGLIAEIAKGYGVRYFVFASTCSVYGASEQALDEQIERVRSRFDTDQEFQGALAREGLTVRDLRKRFKFVVIDSPPVLPVTDAMILSTLVDGVVFVVESGATVRGAVTRARKILKNVGANVLGIVLNKVDVRHDGYYGEYGHSYYRSEDEGPTANPAVISPTLAG